MVRAWPLVSILCACGFPQPDIRRDAPVDVAADGRMADAGLDADVTAPALQTSFPANGSTGISRTATVAVVFTEPVTHVDGGSFLLKQGSTSVSGSVSMSTSRDYMFTPSASLVANTTYTVTLTAGILDLSNNALAATSLTFVTAP
jgi:hypothetical protein